MQELDEEEGNFSQLEQEVEDLKESRKTLMETLKRLEAESKTLFEDTFQEARKNFQEIFRKLFQGGKLVSVSGNEWQINPKPAEKLECKEATKVADNGDTTISFQ